MTIEFYLLLFAGFRFLIGLSPVFAASISARLLGFPPTHENATATLMARLFGVRDIGLGVIAVAAVQGIVPLDFAIVFNVAHDLADAVMAGIPLVRRQGIDRGAATSLVFALVGASCWFFAYSLL